MSNTADDAKWDRVITANPGIFSLNLRRVWEYQDLIAMFVKRDFIIYYKQTILGPLWYLIQPVCSAIMYMFVFGTLARLGTDSIPQLLFYYSGTMLWGFFSSNFNSASNVFYTNKNLFGKVFFPRIICPIADTISHLIRLGIQLLLLILIYIYYISQGMHFAAFPQVLLTPLVLLWVGLLSVGMGIVVSSLTTKYRDLSLALGFMITMAMYITPVVYPLSETPEGTRILFYFNPMCAPMELFRLSLFGVSSANGPMVALGLLYVLVFLFAGLLLFHKNEKTFIDVI